MQCWSADTNPQGSLSFWEAESGSGSPSFWELYPDPHQGAKPDLPQSAMSDPDPHQREKLKLTSALWRHGGLPWSLVLQIRISLIRKRISIKKAKLEPHLSEKPDLGADPKHWF
jgi:hypothetical protein